MITFVLAGFGIAYGLFSASPGLPLEPYQQPPYSYGTEFDCRNVVSKYGADGVWVGRIAGRISDDGPNIRQISDVACFPRASECHAWLAFWDGKINGELFQKSCRRGYQR